MLTKRLIDALVADAETKPLGLGLGFGVAIVCGTSIAVLCLVALIGWREDVLDAILQPRVQLKFGLAAVLAAVATGLAHRLARPAAPAGGWLWVAAGVPGILLVACLIELVAMPPSTWAGRSVGSSASLCLTAIPGLAMAPFACLMLALRHGAPTRPGLAGAVAGLAASAIAAMVYAASCPDDSPLFVALWYPLACLSVTALGAALGPRVLRW